MLFENMRLLAIFIGCAWTVGFMASGFALFRGQEPKGHWVMGVLVLAVASAVGIPAVAALMTSTVGSLPMAAWIFIGLGFILLGFWLAREEIFFN